VSAWGSDTSDRNRATVWVIWAFVLVAAVTLAWVFLVNPLLVDKKGDTYRDSYGSEVARIDAARQGVVAYEAAVDEGQRKALVNQVCALIADTDEVPSDLTAWKGEHC
jgi:hypothetical protein